MGSNAKSMELVNEMPITEDMLIMIGGTSISEEQIKALRLLCVEQFSDVIK